jgi:hypothetical protein
MAKLITIFFAVIAIITYKQPKEFQLAEYIVTSEEVYERTSITKL